MFDNKLGKRFGMIDRRKQYGLEILLQFLFDIKNDFNFYHSSV